MDRERYIVTICPDFTPREAHEQLAAIGLHASRNYTRPLYGVALEGVNDALRQQVRSDIGFRSSVQIMPSMSPCRTLRRSPNHHHSLVRSSTRVYTDALFLLFSRGWHWGRCSA